MITTITVLLTSVFATAFISGVLSLGGGSILMGIFGWILPIYTLVVLCRATEDLEVYFPIDRNLGI